MVHLNLIVIRTKDMEQAAAFYRLLGLEFHKHRHGNGLEHYASEQDTLVFEIYPLTDTGETSTGTRLGFSVHSIDVLLERLGAAGVQVVSPPKDSPWGRHTAVADPDGHHIALTAAVSDTPAY